MRRQGCSADSSGLQVTSDVYVGSGHADGSIRMTTTTPKSAEPTKMPIVMAGKRAHSALLQRQPLARGNGGTDQHADQNQRHCHPAHALAEVLRFTQVARQELDLSVTKCSNPCLPTQINANEGQNQKTSTLSIYYSCKAIPRCMLCSRSWALLFDSFPTSTKFRRCCCVSAQSLC